MATLQKIKLIGVERNDLPFGAGITGRTDINTFSAEYASPQWGNAGQTEAVPHARIGGNTASFGFHPDVRYVALHDFAGSTATLGPDPAKAFLGAPSGPFTTWSARYYFNFNGMPLGDTFFGLFPEFVSTLAIMNGGTKLDPLVCLDNKFPRTNYGKLLIPGRTGYTSTDRSNQWVRVEVQFNDAFDPNMVVRLYQADDLSPFQTWTYNVPWSAATGLALTSGDNGQVTTGFPGPVSIAYLEFCNTYNLDDQFPGDGTAVATALGQNPDGAGTPETEVIDYTYPADQAVRFAPVTLTHTPISAGFQYANDPVRTADVYIPGGPAPEGGFPVIFWTHGGYFVGGSRLDIPLQWRNALLNAGYAVISVDYVNSTLTNNSYGNYGDPNGLLPGPAWGRYPSWFVDVKLCAARFPAKAASEGWDINLDSFFTSGHSAGGFIAAAAAASEGVTDDGGGRDLTIAGNPDYADGYTGPDPTFSGSIIYSGVLDMQAAADYDLNDPGLPPFGLPILGWATDRGAVAMTTRPFIGVPATRVADPDLSFTSVPEIVNARSAIGEVPPVLAFWGTGDQLINKWSHDPQMAAAMSAAGSTYISDDVSTIHDWINEEFKLAPMLEFLESNTYVPVIPPFEWEFSDAEWWACREPVVSPEPYPSPPTVSDSTVPAQPRLDIGHYQVGVYSRGGEHRLTMLPRVSALNFKRTLDDTSSASVTCVSEEWADLIHPWQHEIHIFRNNRLAWCGPVRDKEYDPETGTIVLDCRDLFAWMDFRRAHNEIDLLETDVADVFVALMESALSADPSPNILIDKTAVGSTIDFYYDPEIPKIVAEDLRQMAESGVDYTTYLRTVIVRGEYLDKAPIGTMLRAHLAKMPLVKESGEMATQLLLTGAGGDLHSHPDVALTPAQWDLHPYGLLEQIYDGDKLFDSDDVSAIEKAAKSRYELMKEPRLFLSEMQLNASAPVEMEDLIPGRRIDVKMDVGAIPLISMYRLQTLSVDVDGTSETIKLEVTSLGDYDKDTPI
jgi:acetyl esterase/lipase